MKKNLFLLFCIFILLAAGDSEAAVANLIWDPVPASDGYRLYERQHGQAYDYSAPIWTGTATAATLNPYDQTPVYYVVRAFIGTNESGNSNEVMFYGGEAVDRNASIDALHSNVFEIAPLIPCYGFTVYYREYGNTTWVPVNRTGVQPYPLLLPQGLWEIRVVTYDQSGNMLSEDTSLKYAPKMKVDYISTSATNLAELALIVRWDELLCPWAANYEVRAYGRLSDAIALNDNFVSQDIVPSSEAEKATYLLASNASHFYFVAVIPYDAEGQIVSMGVQVAWVQPGNILGTFNTGTAWDKAKVDSADYNYLSLNWYKPVAGRPFDYKNGLSSYVGFTLDEASDSNNDGIRTSPDLQMIQLHWLRTGASYY